MKKYTTFIIMLMCLALLCTACGGSDTPDADTDAELPAADTAEPEKSDENDKDGSDELKPPEAEEEEESETAEPEEENEEEQPEEETEEPSEPEEAPAPEPVPISSLEGMPLEFAFSSGAGAWATMITLNADGTFSGEYHDSDMGDMGEEYPNGTVYISTFSGKFTDMRQVDEYTCSMHLGSVTTERAVGDEWIEDGVRYIASEPAGIDGGRTFLLFMPGAPTGTMDEDFRYWDQGGMTSGETISGFGLYNVDEGTGFFAS